VKPKSKSKSKPKPKVKSKPKKRESKKSKKPVKKREVAAKSATRKKDANRTRRKKEKLSNLFATVKPKHTVIQVTKKPLAPKVKQELIKLTDKPLKASDRISSSLKIQKQSDSGIENAYFAKVEEKLKGWPAQSDYAGEKAKVWLKIAPDGYFEFKLLSASNNEGFNSGLITYLKQLQRFGFGAHKGTRPYEIEVEFIATE
jgi:protein TonB